MSDLLPDTLQIGPHRYDVVTTQDGWDQLSRDLDSDPSNAGLSNAFRGVIALAPGQSSSQQADTVVHEALHMILNATDLPSVVAHVWKKDHDADLVDEAVATLLAPWLLMFIQDNPDLIDWIRAQT